MRNIYGFCNTGVELPSDIGPDKIEYFIQAPSLRELFGHMINPALFVVFTNVEGKDFVVKTEEEAEILRSLLALSNNEYKVDVMPISIWYNDKVKHTIIISQNVKFTKVGMEGLLNLFLNNVLPKPVKPELKEYFVYNVRTEKFVDDEVFMDLEKAKNYCDKTPCTVVKDKNGNILYRSKYGKSIAKGPVTISANKQFNIKLPK